MTEYPSQCPIQVENWNFRKCRAVIW